jgi:GT2 family glycosyltransferase
VSVRRGGISFIIVNRNTAALLVECIDHIHACVIGREFEIIVVDNGSTDDSVASIRCKYPQVRIIEAARNLGFAAANNLAAKEATGEFLFLVNTDAMLERKCPERLVSLLELDASIGIIGPKLINPDLSPQTSFESVPTLATETLNRSLLKRLCPTRYPSKFSDLTEPTAVEALIGAVMVIRKSLFDEIGGFDEGYFFFMEETDLMVRIREAGYKVVHDPVAKAVHLQGGTAKSSPAAAKIEFYRSRYRFFEKHYGLQKMLMLKCVIVANLLVSVVGLGLLNAFTGGAVKSLNRSLDVKAALWKWHARGCPEGEGLPRT